MPKAIGDTQMSIMRHVEKEERLTKIWNGIIANRIENCKFDDPIWEQDLRNVLRFCHQIRQRNAQPTDGLAIALSAANIIEGFYAHLARATDREYAELVEDLRSAEGADAGEDLPSGRGPR